MARKLSPTPNELIEHLRKIMHIPDGVRGITVRASHNDAVVCEVEYLPAKHNDVNDGDES